MNVLLTREGNIAVVTLNRPESLNALNQELEDELLAALEEVAIDREVRCVVLTGAGRGFCSGADMKNRKGNQADLTPALRYLENRKLPVPFKVIPLLRRMHKPVIAAVNGVAAGAGFSMVLACDFRIASDTARFTSVYIKRGLVPDAGQSYYLPRVVGTSMALEIMLSGDMISAADALAMGLVRRVVPAEELLKEATAFAEKLAKSPPIAVGYTKQLVYQGLENDLITQIDDEMRTQALVRSTADHVEAVKAFVEKRPPNFTGE